MSRVLIIGMSHVGALTRAIEELDHGSDPMEYEAVNLRVSPDICDLKRGSLLLENRTWRRPDVVCLALEGNQHNVFSLLHTKHKFRLGDAALGAVPALTSQNSSELQFVPRDMLKSEFKSKLWRIDAFAATIHAFFPQARFLHICAPPPVLAMPPKPPPEEQPEGFDMMLYYLDFDACPPDLRLKIYELQTEIFAEVAARHGAVLLDPPRQARRPDGFLDTAYFDVDPTHGNSRYGKLVLAQIEAFIGEEVAS